MSTKRTVVGRDAETAVIREAAAQAQRGGPQVIHIEGFVGTGKQRLVREALRPFGRSLEITVNLTREDSVTPGAGFSELFHRAGLGTPPQNLSAMVQITRDWARSLTGLTVVVIKNAHWLDEESAEAARSLFADLDQAPMLLIATARPNTRCSSPAIPSARTMTLGTFSQTEIREVLGQYIPTPLGPRVIAQVQEQTGGLPVLVDQIGKHLSQAPIGQRRLAHAVEATSSNESAKTSALINELLRVIDDEHHPTINILCAAHGSLPHDQLNRLLGADHGIEQLVAAGIVDRITYAEGQERFALHSEILARVLSRRIPTEQLSQLHLRIAAVADTDDAIYHRAQAALLTPELQETDQLLTELDRAAELAQQRGDIEATYRHRHAAARLHPDERTLSLLLEVAAPRGNLEALTHFSEELAQLPPGPLRQGALALHALAVHDMEGALVAIKAQYGIDYRTVGALIYAQAMAHISTILSIRGMTGRAVTAKSQTTMMLSDYEAHLLTRISNAEEDARTDLEYERARAAGLRVIITMWQLLEDRDPEVMRETLGRVSDLLAELQGIPHTEIFQAGVLAGRGGRYKQLSEPNRAFKDLSGVLKLTDSGTFASYARLNLANVLFVAGFWDESEKLALESVEDALVTGEDVQTLIMYGTAALVPLCRGEIEKVGPMMVELDAVRESYGPQLSAAMHWGDAVTSLVIGEHDTAVQNFLRMRQEAGGWWNIGLEPLMLLARSACYADMGHIVHPLLRTLGSGHSSGTEGGYHVYVESFLKGWIARERGDAFAALEHFSEAPRWLDDHATLTPYGAERPADPFSLHKGFFAIDFATTVATFPGELSGYREQALAELDWAIAMFDSRGSQGLAAQARAAREELLAAERTVHPVGTVQPQ